MGKNWRDLNGYYRDDKGVLDHRTKAFYSIYQKHRDKYPLPFSKYVVHHKDGNKVNNQIENLEVMKQEEHERLHSLNKSNSYYGYAGEDSGEYSGEREIDRLIGRIEKENGAYGRYYSTQNKTAHKYHPVQDWLIGICIACLILFLFIIPPKSAEIEQYPQEIIQPQQESNLGPIIISKTYEEKKEMCDNYCKNNFKDWEQVSAIDDESEGYLRCICRTDSGDRWNWINLETGEPLMRVIWLDHANKCVTEPINPADRGGVFIGEVCRDAEGFVNNK